MLSLNMLKIARRFLGYTQEQLAQKIGKSQKYYTQIETGSSKSSPILSKLSDFLKIKESFLGSSGEYIEYPFLSDFYVFSLTERDLFQLYKDIIEYICSKSDFIDVVFLLVRPSLIGIKPTFGGYPIMYVAIRDDRNTVFLIKRHIRTRDFGVAAKQRRDSKEIEIKTFSRVDSFREMLHSLAETHVYEMTKMIPEELYKRIENGTVARDDILQFFPTAAYFLGQYEGHKKIKIR